MTVQLPLLFSQNRPLGAGIPVSPLDGPQRTNNTNYAQPVSHTQQDSFSLTSNLPADQYGFIQLAAKTGASRKQLSEIKADAEKLKQAIGVDKVHVYKAAMPFSKYNVVTLVQTKTIADAQNLLTNADFAKLSNSMSKSSRSFHTLIASTARKIDDVDRDRPGLFIFNFFDKLPNTVDQTAQDIAGWDREAVAFKKAGLNNSTLLQPLPGTASDYTIVNHARWNQGGLLNIFFTVATNPALRNKAPNSHPTMYRLA